MVELECPNCNQVIISDPTGWDILGDEIEHCGKQYSVEYDETYDPDTNGEWGWFYLQPTQK